MCWWFCFVTSKHKGVLSQLHQHESKERPGYAWEITVRAIQQCCFDSSCSSTTEFFWNKSFRWVLLWNKNYFSQNNFSSLGAAEMKVTENSGSAQGIHSAQICWSALQHPQVLNSLKPVGMLQFQSTVSKTERRHLTGKYPQCLCRPLLFCYFKIAFSKCAWISELTALSSRSLD